MGFLPLDLCLPPLLLLLFDCLNDAIDHNVLTHQRLLVLFLERNGLFLIIEVDQSLAFGLVFCRDQILNVNRMIRTLKDDLVTMRLPHGRADRQ